jgi:hypothetical protein
MNESNAKCIGYKRCGYKLYEIYELWNVALDQMLALVNATLPRMYSTF